MKRFLTYLAVAILLGLAVLGALSVVRMIDKPTVAVWYPCTNENSVQLTGCVKVDLTAQSGSIVVPVCAIYDPNEDVIGTGCKGGKLDVAPGETVRVFLPVGASGLSVQGLTSTSEKDESFVTYEVRKLPDSGMSQGSRFYEFVVPSNFRSSETIMKAKNGGSEVGEFEFSLRTQGG